MSEFIPFEIRSVSQRNLVKCFPLCSKRWTIKEVDHEASRDNRRTAQNFPAVGPHTDLARLRRRGKTARRYLSSSLRADLPSPFEMADMEPAVRRVIDAIKNKEQIAIWGDYDVDGTTGAAVLVSFLREIGAEPIYYVPHRIEEGYGLNVEGLRRLRERGVDLVITVDCGISNAVEIQAAVEMGLFSCRRRSSSTARRTAAGSSP